MTGDHDLDDERDDAWWYGPDTEPDEVQPRKERDVSEPEKAWTLPSAEITPILAAALGRTLAREAAGTPRNRAYTRCRRWHRRWRGEMFIANGKPAVDCSRCGLRWVW